MAFCCFIIQKIPRVQPEVMHLANNLLQKILQSLIKEVVLETTYKLIKSLAVNVVRDLQEISFDLIRDVKQVLDDVRALGHDKHLQRYVRNLTKEALILSKAVMELVSDVDGIIQLLKYEN